MSAAEAKVKTYLVKRKLAVRVTPRAHPKGRIRIDKKVPFPVENRGGFRDGTLAHYYPFEEMNVGDSFWVQGESKCTGGAITRFSKITGWKFISRGQTKDGRPNGDVSGTGAKRGLRIWRMS